MYVSSFFFSHYTRLTFKYVGLGDTPFKQPPEFTRRILYNLLPGFHDTSPWEEFLVRNRTPPYISAEPEIIHHLLDETSPSIHPRFLILCSDGFSDLCSGEGQQSVITDWAKSMVTNKVMMMAASPPSLSPLSSSPMSPTAAGTESSNMALRLLRRALGGDDRSSVSRVLTLEMEGAWIDDTSVIVQTL